MLHKFFSIIILAEEKNLHNCATFFFVHNPKENFSSQCENFFLFTKWRKNFLSRNCEEKKILEFCNKKILSRKFSRKKIFFRENFFVKKKNPRMLTPPTPFAKY